MSSSRGQVSAAPSRRMGPETFSRRRRTALWWLTNAGFLINSHGTLLMMDPAISPYPDSPGTHETGLRLLASLPLEAADVSRLDAVLYTHADEDHFPRLTAERLACTGALFVGPPPVADALPDLGVPEARIRIARVGQPISLGPLEITPTPADHPWQLRDPDKFGPPWRPEDCCGYLVSAPEGKIWNPGDTRLMDEHVQMQDISVLLLDVSRSEYHLGVDNAARLANILDVPHIIAHHYGTYDAPEHPAYNGDPAEVAARIRDADRRFHVLAPGQEFVLARR